MQKIKKQLAVAVTVALLTLPLSSLMVFADTVNTPSTTVSTTSETTTPETTTPETTTPETTTPETTTPETTTPETTTPETTTPETTTPETTTPETTTPDTETPETPPVIDADGNEVAPSNWLTSLIGKLQLALTFDPVHKCQLSERLALAKLAEAQKLMMAGKIEASHIALNKYAEKITQAQEFLEQVEDPDSEKAKKLNLALTNVNSNNVIVLGNLLEKLPQQAAQKLALNVVRSMEKAVKKIEKQEAKLALATASEPTTETVPATTPPVTESETTPEPEVVTITATTSAMSNKSLEKQAKVALKEFKKSLKQKCNIQIEDAEQQEDEDIDGTLTENTIPSTEVVSMNNSQPTSITVAPAKLQQTQTSARSFVQDKKDRNKQEEKGKDKSRDNNDRDKKNKSEKRDDR